jgi:general secretion pathway protein F
VPVLRAIDVLSRQDRTRCSGEILKEVHSDVSGGETLANAMAKHPNAFNELAIAMVRAGEQGGFLEDVLARISTFTERQDELRNKLLGSMIYPCILLLAGIVVVTFLMAFVVPKIRMFLDRAEKPWLTTASVRHLGLRPARLDVSSGRVAVALVFVVPLFRSEAGQEALDRLKLTGPR